MSSVRPVCDQCATDVCVPLEKPILTTSVWQSVPVFLVVGKYDTSNGLSNHGAVPPSRSAGVRW